MVLLLFPVQESNLVRGSERLIRPVDRILNGGGALEWESCGRTNAEGASS